MTHLLVLTFAIMFVVVVGLYSIAAKDFQRIMNTDNIDATDDDEHYCLECNNTAYRSVNPGGDDSKQWIAPCAHVPNATKDNAAAYARADGWDVAWALAFMDDPATQRQCQIEAWPFILAHDLTDDVFIETVNEPDLAQTVKLYLREEELSENPELEFETDFDPFA